MEDDSEPLSHELPNGSQPELLEAPPRCPFSLLQTVLDGAENETPDRNAFSPSALLPPAATASGCRQAQADSAQGLWFPELELLNRCQHSASKAKLSARSLPSDSRSPVASLPSASSFHQIGKPTKTPAYLGAAPPRLETALHGAAVQVTKEAVEEGFNRPGSAQGLDTKGRTSTQTSGSPRRSVQETWSQDVWSPPNRTRPITTTRRGSLPLMLERWKEDTSLDPDLAGGSGESGSSPVIDLNVAEAMQAVVGLADVFPRSDSKSPDWNFPIRNGGEDPAEPMSSGTTEPERPRSKRRQERQAFVHTPLHAGIPELGVLEEDQLERDLLIPETGDDMAGSLRHSESIGSPVRDGLASPLGSASQSSGQRDSSSSHAHRLLRAPSEAVTGRRSNLSRSSGGRSREGPRRTRHARGNRYSAWEAHTHVPNIKRSWGMAMERSNWEALGLHFYQGMLDAFPELHEHSLKSGDKVDVVRKLSDMLHTIVSAADSPSELRERLQALAPLHLKKGVTDAHMAPMGKIVIGVVQGVLGEDFTPEMQAAWNWLWAWISGVMSETLLDARLQSDALSQSWDMACDRLSDDEIGGLLCDSLMQLAPNLKSSIFPIPRQILAPRFFEMISTLRSFHNDHERMREQVTWLAMRHLQYKARPEHVQTFGQCLVAGLEQAVGEDEWTPAMAKAWLDLWNETCQIMMAIIGEAEKHGVDVQEMWGLVRDKSSPTAFGESLRKDLLLSGALFETFQVADTWKSKAQRERLLGAYFQSWLEGCKEKKVRRSSRTGSMEGVSLLASMTGSHVSEPEEEEEEQDDFLSFQAGAVKVTHKGHGINENMLGRLKDDSAEALGKRIWELLGSGLDLLWEPEMQNESFMIAAKELHEWGLRDRDLDVLGLAINTTLRRTLGEEYTQHREASWAWFWRTVRDPLGRMLADSERDSAAVLRESWHLIQSVTTTEHLAELFFAELDVVAPHVVHLFKLPKKMQAIRLHSICELLIKFFEAPDVFFARFKQLAIRHISYGVRADMTKPFGTALVTAIQKAVGDKLDPALERAWADLWTRASTCVTRSLAIASNLVVVALVQGDIAKLKEALDCAPRCERWMWLLRVKVNGESISPLLWAIRDGRFSMAHFMLQDILAIRADRSAYFFGHEALWETHPGVVGVLVKESPELLETVLDGHMWHSSAVEEGMVRVNYYLANLYGDPDKYPEVWESPLATLVLRGEPDIFMHPVVTKLLELKWRHFARVLFLGEMVWFSLLLAAFMLGCIVHPDDCRFSLLRSALGVASLASLLAMLSIALSQHLRGQSTPTELLIPIKLPVPFFLANIWNLSRFCSCALLVVTALLDPCVVAGGHAGLHDSDTPGGDGAVLDVGAAMDVVWYMDRQYAYKALSAVVAILLWLQLVQAFSVSTRLAAFSYTIGIMFQDVLHNLVVIAIFLFAFASALTAIDEKPMLGSLPGWILLLMREVLNLDHENLDQTTNFGGTLLMIFSILTTVGMLNMLIAQLSLAYESMADHKLGFAKKHRAAICVDIESMLSVSLRRRLFCALGFDKPVPFGTGDDGPAGGMQVFEPAQSVRGDPRYRPDRIIRFTQFEASPRDPWPQHCATGEEASDEGDGAEAAHTPQVTIFKSFNPANRPMSHGSEHTPME